MFVVGVPSTGRADTEADGTPSADELPRVCDHGTILSPCKRLKGAATRAGSIDFEGWLACVDKK